MYPACASMFACSIQGLSATRKASLKDPLGKDGTMLPQTPTEPSAMTIGSEVTSFAILNFSWSRFFSETIDARKLFFLLD